MQVQIGRADYVAHDMHVWTVYSLAHRKRDTLVHSNE